MALMKRTHEMQSFINSVTKELFGQTAEESAIVQSCVFCKGSADTFRDELSRKEYGISRLCQKCQDEVFGGE